MKTIRQRGLRPIPMYSSPSLFGPVEIAHDVTPSPISMHSVPFRWKGKKKKMAVSSSVCRRRGIQRRLPKVYVPDVLLFHSCKTVRITWDRTELKPIVLRDIIIIAVGRRVSFECKLTEALSTRAFRWKTACAAWCDRNNNDNITRKSTNSQHSDTQ